PTICPEPIRRSVRPLHASVANPKFASLSYASNRLAEGQPLAPCLDELLAPDADQDLTISSPRDNPLPLTSTSLMPLIPVGIKAGGLPALSTMQGACQTNPSRNRPD